MQLKGVHGSWGRTVSEVFKDAEFPVAWHKEISDYCKAIGIDFSTSPYFKEAVDLCVDLDVPFIKIGSGDITWLEMLDYIARKGKPVMLTHYPQIEIEVYQGTYDDVKEWLRTGQVDIAFLSSTCREEFNLTELFREPLLCIVPQDWPEPENGVMTPALMNGQSFVVQCDATDAEMRQFLKKYKIGTERRCHVIDDQSNIAMVEAGLGISIMPRMLLRSCTAAVKIYPIEPEEYRVVGLAVQRPTAMAPAVEQMFHHIVDFCRQMDPQLL